MAVFDITLQGEAEVLKILTRVGLAMDDLEGAMSDVGQHAIKYFSGQVFASRGSVIGQPWAPLNPTYAAHKARLYPGRPPLVRTGLMQRSFTSDPSKMQVTIGNSAPYFQYHQSSAERSKLPRRAMIGLSEQLQSDIVETVRSSLINKIRGVMA
jgi:phage gpG-like protein